MLKWDYLLLREMSRNKVVGVVFALVGAVMFSAKAIFVKIAYGIQPDLDAVTLIMFRMGFALPFFIIILLLELRKKKVKFDNRTLAKIFVMGFVGYYLGAYFDFKGLQYLDASLERVILYIYPTFVLILSFFFNKKKIKPVQLLAIGITYLGVIVAFQGRIEQSSNIVLGTVLIVLCSLTYSLYLVGSESLVGKLGAKLLTSSALIVSSVCVLVHKVIVSGSTMPLTEVEPKVMGVALLIAIFSTVIPSFLVTESIRRLGASNAAILASIGPISTIIMAHFVLGEQISSFLIYGTLVVILGISLITFSRKA